MIENRHLLEMNVVVRMSSPSVVGSDAALHSDQSLCAGIHYTSHPIR